MIETLSKQATGELLAAQRVGHLGCVLKTGEPYVVPVNYLYRDDEIYIHCLPGQKLDALRENRRVCLQVEKIEDNLHWQSVIVFGEFHEIKRTNEKIGVLRDFNQRFSRLTPVEAMTAENWNAGGVVVFRIDVRRITGLAENQACPAGRRSGEAI